jgi:hypothetical protein
MYNAQDMCLFNNHLHRKPYTKLLIYLFIEVHDISVTESSFNIHCNTPVLFPILQ